MLEHPLHLAGYATVSEFKSTVVAHNFSGEQGLLFPKKFLVGRRRPPVGREVGDARLGTKPIHCFVLLPYNGEGGDARLRNSRIMCTPLSIMCLQ